jgi:hypothetical protein
MNIEEVLNVISAELSKRGLQGDIEQILIASVKRSLGDRVDPALEY